MMFLKLVIFSASASVDSHSVGNDFDHLIAHFMTCALDEEIGCAMKYGRLRFGSPHEVINEMHVGCLWTRQEGAQVGFWIMP